MKVGAYKATTRAVVDEEAEAAEVDVSKVTTAIPVALLSTQHL